MTESKPNTQTAQLIVPGMGKDMSMEERMEMMQTHMQMMQMMMGQMMEHHQMEQ